MAAQRGTWNKSLTGGERNIVASIQKEFIIDAPAERVWAALKDVGAVHVRLVPGLVTDTALEGDTRTITFSNGLVVREKIVDVDNERRRVAYSASGVSMTYHHASMQVLPDGESASRFIWVADVQPESARDNVAALMDKGSEIIRSHLAR